MKKDKSKIPRGYTCYDSSGPCPYWGKIQYYPEQDNGYCSYLKTGDWDVGFGFLWDQIKLCNINPDDDSYYEYDLETLLALSDDFKTKNTNTLRMRKKTYGIPNKDKKA